MATLGYVFGTLAQRRKGQHERSVASAEKRLVSCRDGRQRAGKSDLSAVSSSTAKHYARLKRFQNRIAKLGTQQGMRVWHELCREVEDMLDPTLELVGEITNAQERIRYQSNYLMTLSEVRTDPLTGLDNRPALDQELSTQFSLLRRYGTPFSLAVVDIDQFKNLNDERGHLYGDQVLRDLAELLTDTARTVDILARYGGDEFVIVMPQTDPAGAGTLAERLRAKVAQELPFTISVGVASANDADTPESLFHRADAALYRAKTDGRNRTCCDPHFTGEMVAALPDPQSLKSQFAEVGILIPRHKWQPF